MVEQYYRPVEQYYRPVVLPVLVAVLPLLGTFHKFLQIWFFFIG